MTFYGIVYSDSEYGRAPQVFREKMLALSVYEKTKKNLKAGENISLYTRSRDKDTAVSFGRDLRNAIQSGVWDADWVTEQSDMKSAQSELDADLLMDNLAGQLGGVLKLAKMGNLDIRTLMSRAVSDDADLMKACGVA